MTYYVESVHVPDCVMVEVEHIAATVPVIVFYDEHGNALLLANDYTYVVHITHDTVQAYVKTAYTSNQPLEETINAEALHPATAKDFKGFESGFTC